MIHAILYAKDQTSLARPRLPGELGVMVFLKIDPRLDNLQSDSSLQGSTVPHEACALAHSEGRTLQHRAKLRPHDLV